MIFRSLRRPLFWKPRWLKPEFNEVIYWVHLAIIAVLFLWGFDRLFGAALLTWTHFFASILMLAVADLKAHTILQLD